VNKRIDINALEPNAYKGMFGLEKYLSTTTLDARMKELIKIRASQINGCAYCIQMHTEAARKMGESEQRLYALAAWKESPLFSDPERAVLALTDEMTLIASNGLSKECYEAALQALGENALAEAMMQIVTINAWNRVAVATAMQHEET
jgi:AhpD family alkylhydroperoxidase